MSIYIDDLIEIFQRVQRCQDALKFLYHLKYYIKVRDNQADEGKKRFYDEEVTKCLKQAIDLIEGNEQSDAK